MSLLPILSALLIVSVPATLARFLVIGMTCAVAIWVKNRHSG